MHIIVTGDGSRTLLDPEHGETFGSRHGAMTEALHVFLHGSGVAARLAAGVPTRVLEVGFGTGLNFLVTAAAVAAGPITPRPALHYTALERAPLDARTLTSLHRGSSGHCSATPGPVEELVTWFANAGDLRGTSAHRIDLMDGRVTLELLVCDAAALPDGVGGDPVADRHAVYLDAFSPRTSPSLWSPAFLGWLAARLAPGGTLVTYSVNGPARRALAAAGLLVGKRPGPPGGKAEMLVATRPSHADGGSP